MPVNVPGPIPRPLVPILPDVGPLDRDDVLASRQKQRVKPGESRSSRGSNHWPLTTFLKPDSCSPRAEEAFNDWVHQWTIQPRSHLMACP